jgi:hypothetical protein
MIKAAEAATDAAVIAGNGLVGWAVWIQYLQGAEALVALGVGIALGLIRIKIALREYRNKPRGR